MPTTRFSQAVTAGATVSLLVNSLFEVVRAPGALVVAAVVETAALQTMLMSVLADNETLLEESPIPVEAGANQGPKIPDDVILREDVQPGDKLTIRLRNTDIATRTARVVVSIP